MIKNFFKAIGLGVKDLIFGFLCLYLYIGIIPTVLILLMLLLSTDRFIQYVTETMLYVFLGLGLVSPLLNALIANFINHCVEASRYAKNHDIDIKTVFETTSTFGNDY